MNIYKLSERSFFRRPFAQKPCLRLMAFLVLFLAGMSTSVSANNSNAEITVKGTILDENGIGLPGVSILEKGTTNGTISDIDGVFELKVNELGTVVFSFIGYSTEEFAARSIPSEISMTPNAGLLEEVVVIGYGSVKKSDLTGAVSSIQTADITRANPVQAAAALQGQVAGVNIQKIKGRPGDGFTIDIRGLNNFDENNEGLNEPLVVIDGVIGGNMNNLNPNDIEAIDVLKDASSTAIYGSRGANGVIIITTKRGKSGKPRVSYDAYVGSKVPAHIPKMMNAQQFYQTYNFDRVAQGGKVRGWTSSEIANAEAGRTVDWIDMVTDPTLQMSHTLSLSGGTDNTTFDFSAGYLDEGGNTLNTGFKRYTIKGGMESQLHDMVKVGFTSYFTYSNQVLATQEVLRSAYRARPTGTNLYKDVLNPAESSDIDWKGYAVFMGVNDAQVIHPLVEVDPENARRENRTSALLANGFVELTPVKGLSLRTSLSTAVTSSKQGDYFGRFTKTQATTKDPRASLQTNDLSSYTLDNILTYNLSGGRHAVTITGLHSVFYERFENSAIAVQDLPFRSLWHNIGTGTVTAFGSGLTERALTSYMGRVNYSFADKYLLTLTGRTDGASQLSEGNKWAFFPSAAIAWRMAEESFIQNLNVFSNLKMRLSYGVVGNSSVRPYQTQANISQTAYDFGGTPAYGFAINNLANRDLVWEKSKEINFGLDMGFFGGRVAASVELYKRNTEDLILPDKLPTSTGFSDVTANVGEIQNSGIELALNTVNMVRSNFKWNTTITVTHNNDKVVKLAGGITEDIGNLRFVGESVKPVYSWVFDGIWQLDEADEAAIFKQKPGEVKLVDLNGDGAITADDRKILGSETPDLLLGIRNQVLYKNIDFSFFVYTRQGVMYDNQFLRGTFGEINSDRYNRSAEIDFWTPDNPSNTYFGLLTAGLDNHPVRGNTRVAIQKQLANFWRVSDITLGYTLPQRVLDRMGLSHFRLYGQVSNPLVFTDYLGFNPEYNSGVNDDDVPFAVYLFGVNVSF
ncbi:MAG: TonB-dependent receptor [Saprospiraceae bacterium]